MTEPAKRNATYDDLLALPEDLRGEIIFGSLYVLPRPATPHIFSATSLSEELVGPFQKGRGGGPGGWVFGEEPQLHLGPHVVVPDLAGWRKARLPHLPETTFIEVAPDWICELLSPSTEARDRGAKRRIYGTYGVGHLWYLDPVSRLLEVFVLSDGRWVLFETFDGDTSVTAPPFEAVTFPLAALWPLDPAPART